MKLIENVSEEDDEFARQVGPCVITLNEEQWADFMHHMQNPKPPTPRMIEAAKRMRELARRPGDLEYDSWASSLPQNETGK